MLGSFLLTGPAPAAAAPTGLPPTRAELGCAGHDPASGRPDGRYRVPGAIGRPALTGVATPAPAGSHRPAAAGSRTAGFLLALVAFLFGAGAVGIIGIVFWAISRT
jgi:hypothetical protein